MWRVLIIPGYSSWRKGVTVRYCGVPIRLSKRYVEYVAIGVRKMYLQVEGDYQCRGQDIVFWIGGQGMKWEQIFSMVIGPKKGSEMVGMCRRGQERQEGCIPVVVRW